MSLSEKFGIPASLLDAAKKALAEGEAYQQKVKAHMAKKGIKSMSDMTPEQKKKFFNELDSMHTAKNEEVEEVEEGTGVTDYAPKSQGGTRKELLAKYHKSKNPKDAEAARKAGATQKELQGEEFESVEEAQSHAAKTTMKHIDKPTEGEKKAAKDIKPGVAGYRDRIAMLHSAKNRGALKKEDLDSLEDLTDEEIEEFMQTEDYDQLDELSKNTLASYIKKRSNDVATQGALTRKHAMDSEAQKKEHGGYTTKAVRDLDDKANKAFMKGWKHRQNIGKAVDKLTKEELEFIESLNAGTAKE